MQDKLPTRVRSEVQRILDGAARRLLAHELDSDAISAATGTDDDLVDGRTDECSPLIKREAIPIRRSVDRDSGPRAA